MVSSPFFFISMMIQNLLYSALLAILLVCTTDSHVQAQPARESVPPLEHYLRSPAFSAPVVSPDGNQLAVSVGGEGRMNLSVIDLKSRSAARLTNFREFDVISYHWVGNSRLVFSLGQRNTPTGPDRQDGGGLFMVSRDGKQTRVLSPTVRDTVKGGGLVYRGFSYVAPVPNSEEEIIAAASERSADSVDLYRLNVLTGQKVLLTTDTPGRVMRWVLDRTRSPRIAISAGDKTAELIVRARQGESWRELWRSSLGQGSMTVPLYFEPDNKGLVVASNVSRETMGVFRYDIEKNELGELLAQHPRYDMGADQTGSGAPGVVLDPKTESVVGFRVAAEVPQTTWIDQSYERLQRTLDHALPNRVNSFRRTYEGSRWLVTSYSDREPLEWFLFDEEKRTLEPLMNSRPWLKSNALVEMRPFHYKTRDGLEILGYYFLPAGHKSGDKHPTVVHVHGGPWVRADSWGYGSFGVQEAQLLASRGYAVVVPNFRSTPGLGSKIYYGGRGQFGKAMQEDIEDATDWAISQGFADRSRICLSGASYGGYSALMGVAKTPEKYRCAVAGLAVTDLELLMTSGSGDIPLSTTGLALWKDWVGDPSKESAALRAVSPAYLANRIKAPVLMYSGAADIRVPLEQPQKMRRALNAAGQNPEWIVMADEGHGFGVLENNVQLYRRVLDFLAKHIGTAQ